MVGEFVDGEDGLAGLVGEDDGDGRVRAGVVGSGGGEVGSYGCGAGGVQAYALCRPNREASPERSGSRSINCDSDPASSRGMVQASSLSPRPMRPWAWRVQGASVVSSGRAWTVRERLFVVASGVPTRTWSCTPPWAGMVRGAASSNSSSTVAANSSPARIATSTSAPAERTVVPAIVWSVSQGWVWSERRLVKTYSSRSAMAMAAPRRGWLVLVSPRSVASPLVVGASSQ